MKKALSVALVFTAAMASTHAFASDLFYLTSPEFKDTKHGELLVGRDGLALYTFKKDTVSAIPPKCTQDKDQGPLGSCLARWPAAIVDASDMPELIKKDKEFGAVYNNELNKLQLTYSGLPLYYWFKDSNKNNFTGSGVGNAWSLVMKGKSPTMFSGISSN
ncbi:hypothetical protein G6216_004617 [Salmonella enterica subsp. enterica serovar Virchow]|nr:hypothetical protein [Salmonella enterica subsp. enterica serovar Virchow]